MSTLGDTSEVRISSLRVDKMEDDDECGRRLESNESMVVFDESGDEE